jgi:hypothetical protein
MGQPPDPMTTLRACEQILPELKKLSEQELKPEDIKVELEKASKGELIESYLKLISQHHEIIRAFVVLAETAGHILRSNDPTED